MSSSSRNIERRRHETAALPPPRSVAVLHDASRSKALRPPLKVRGILALADRSRSPHPRHSTAFAWGFPQPGVFCMAIAKRVSPIGKPPSSAGGLPKFYFYGNRYGKLPSVSRQSITRGSSIEPSQEFTSQSVGVSVSCRLHPEISKEDDLRPDPRGSGRCHA